MDSERVISFEDAARIIDMANLAGYEPEVVGKDYVAGPYDILLTGTYYEVQAHLITVKAMLASGEIKNAGLQNVKLRIVG
jgi:hypothetical protein